MSDITTQLRQADKLVASKQNRENAIMLIGIDADGNETFEGWIKSDNKITLPPTAVDVRAQAGTLS